MTEAQLRVFPAFKALPIFDESDARADTLTTVQGAGTQYRAIRECPTLQEVQDCLKDSRFIPLGGLRVASTGQVVAYFGERR
jgi:hypothetical protein